METKNIPTHVAVIMDGNGRWAQKRGFSREKGHFAGAKNVPVVAKRLFEKGVKVVSLYAFSEENFSRPSSEVEGIFDRISEFIQSFPIVFGNDVRLVFSGELDKVGEVLFNACKEVESATRQNSPFTLNVLLNYGGRTEILRAARFCKGEPTPSSFRDGLYQSLPDPDLVIRTGGERRLSGFMPYQTAYSELYFCDALFPDFSIEDVDDALSDYANRNRRFGGITP